MQLRSDPSFLRPKSGTWDRSSTCSNQDQWRANLEPSDRLEGLGMTQTWRPWYQWACVVLPHFPEQLLPVKQCAITLVALSIPISRSKFCPEYRNLEVLCRSSNGWPFQPKSEHQWVSSGMELFDNFEASKVPSDLPLWLKFKNENSKLKWVLKLKTVRNGK